MRASGGTFGLHPELAALERRPDSPVRQMLEAQVITRADLRQRKAQWEACDSTTGLTILEDGSVRLTDTVATLIQHTTHDSYFTDLDRAFPLFMPCLELAGTHPAHVEFKRVKIWLHPRRDGGQPKEVAKWRLEILRVQKTLFLSGIPARRQLVLAPIAEPLTVDAVGDAEGLVTFDYSVAPAVDRPKPKLFGPPVFVELLATLFNAAPSPTILFQVTALKADGSPAGNVGLGYASGTASVTTAGNVLSSRRLEAPWQALSIGTLIETGTHADGGAAGGTPRMAIEYGTYANDDITFSAAGNRLDLGAVPTGDVEFLVRGAAPLGTSLIAQVLKDGGAAGTDADWRTYTDGMKVGDPGLPNVTKRQTYEVRAKLLTNASGDLTPTLRGLGVRELTTRDLSDVAEVQLTGAWGIDPLSLRGEITRAVVRGIRDGVRDYRDAITDLLSTVDLGKITFRLWRGTRLLSRDKWLHLEDFLPEGHRPRAADLAIPCVSPLVLVRSLVPKYSPGANYAPDGDQSVGAWTTDAGGGANLYQRIDEASADDVDYIRSELDPANSAYIATLPTPADPTGRRHYVDYRYRKDAAAGKTIALTVDLMQSGTVLSTNIHTDIPDTVTAGSFTLTDAQVAAITDYPNLRLRFTANIGGAGGSRRGIVTWARLRLGGRRNSVVYTNQSLKAVYDDLVNNQLEIDARYRGPGVEDTTTLVSKVISEVTQDAQPTSKAELDAVLYLAGMGLTSSQGRLKAVDMFGPGPVAAIWPLEEFKVLGVTLGIEERQPEFFVQWNWSQIQQKFLDEVRAVHAAGLLAFGEAKLDPPARLEQGIAEYITTEALASKVAQRTVESFGAGRILIEGRTTYRWPELEPGDTVAVELTELVGKDPNAARALAGRQWALARISLVHDANGTHFTLWVRSPADILSAAEGALRGFGAAAFLGVDIVSPTGQPANATVRIRSFVETATIYYLYLATTDAIPAQVTGAPWLTYTGPITLLRDQSVAKKLAVWAADRGIFSPVVPFEIGPDRTPTILTLTLQQVTGTPPSAVTANVSVDTDVRRVAYYRRDNAASGNWPTVSGAVGGVLDPQYLTKTAAIGADGETRFFDGSPGTGGGLSDDGRTSRAGAAPTYANTRYVNVIAVPIDNDGNIGPRASAQIQISGTLPPALTSFSAAKTDDGTDCFPNGAECTVSWTVNASVVDGTHDLEIYRALNGGAPTLIKTEVSPASVLSYVDPDLETKVLAGGPQFSYVYSYKLVPNGGGSALDTGQASAVEFEGDGNCPI